MATPITVDCHDFLVLLCDVVKVGDCMAIKIATNGECVVMRREFLDGHVEIINLDMEDWRLVERALRKGEAR